MKTYAAPAARRALGVLAGRRGQVSFWAVVGILILCTAYLLQPQLFHDFVTWCLDFLFDTLDRFMGAESQKQGAGGARDGT